MKRSFLHLALFAFISPALNAQFADSPPATDIAGLLRLSEEWKKAREESYARGHSIVVSQNRPLRTEDATGEVAELQGADAEGRIIYYGTGNLNAARTVSTRKVWPGGPHGLNLNGSGRSAGEWDGGRARSGHNELSGRVTIMDSTSSVIDHATHVAATIIGAGSDSNARGMAYAASLKSYDWNSDNSEMATAAAGGMILSNHSYGEVTGWRYNSTLSEWEWWGDTTLSGNEDYRFGYYSAQAAQWDLISRNAPYYLIVKSAGNDRGETGTGRHYLPLHSVYSSASRPADGGASGYDCLSTYSGAKNILTVGAVNDIAGGYGGTSSVVMSSFSSWGPTDDGRIKPDIVANGVGVYSALGSGNADYASWNGTSMATPSVTGSLLLLQDLYNDINSTFMKSATLKALAIHTADEAGSNPGPDYVFGWGLLNTEKAALHIADTTGCKDIREESLAGGQTFTLSFTANGNSPVRLTICWTDPAGSPVSASLDPTAAMLVNDLDIRVYRMSDSAIFYPYVLNPASPSSAATSGNNIRDNVEQVYISLPDSGSYSAVVSHKGTLSGSSQAFSLIIDAGNIPPQTPSCILTLNTFPSYQGFDSWSTCSSVSSAACLLPASQGWVNDLTDDIDWKVYNGSTPTTSTGPDVDYSNGTSVGRYLYTESSTAGTGFPNKKAVLYSPCYNLDTMVKPELSFAYHMYGATTGSISVEAYDGFGWTQLWTKSGNQGNQWYVAAVDLTPLAGTVTKIKFTGITGSNITSDMAIDAIEVRERLACQDPQNPAVSSVTDSTAIFSWNSTASYHIIRLHLSDSIELLRASINFNPVLFTGLDPNTWYDVYVMDSCGAGDTSAWAGPVKFRTTGPLSNPSSCGIDAMIPDGACPSLTSFPVEVSSTGTQMGSNVWLEEVRLIIGHTWVSDIIFGLASPSGDTILLSAYNGSSGDNYGNPADTTCSVYTSFTRTASQSITSGTAPFAGAYLPEDSLSLFDNATNPNGTWKFLVCDYYQQDTGYLQYIELVFDTSSCTNPTVSISNSGSDTLCAGSVRTLQTGGGIAYQWYRNGSILAGRTFDTLHVKTAGIYNVKVSVAGGCSDSAAVGKRIIVNPLPVVTISNAGPSAICADTSTVLTASSGISWLWYRNGNSISGATAQALSVNQAGRYNVWLTNSFQCSDSAASPIIITTLALPVVSVTPNGPTQFCQGGSVTLSTIHGNSYKWYRNGLALPAAVDSTYIATAPGSYNVRVTATNSCDDSSASHVVVLVDPLPVVVISLTAGDTIMCQGDSAALSTATGFSSYSWMRGGQGIPGGVHPDIIARVSGIYNVLVTDVNGCSDSAFSGVRVVVHDLPFVSLSADDSSICSGDSATITASPGFNYAWKRNGIPVPGAFNSTLKAGLAGWYNVVATTTNFCSDTADLGISISILALPVASFNGTFEYCNTQGPSLLTGGLPAGGIYSGLTVTGVSGQYFFDPSQAGPGNFVIVYEFEDQNGCSDTASNVALVKNCLGISAVKPGGFAVYPNPSGGRIYVQGRLSGGDVLSYEIFDMHGKLAAANFLIPGGQAAEIDLGGLNSGLYFIRLSGRGGSFTQKIILDKNLE